jgi:hypothetical protein
MTARRLQWVAIAALGCVGLDDVAGDDARLLGPEAAYRIQIEWRSTLPLAGTIWPVLTPPSLDEPFMPSRSGCQTGGDREGQG